MAASTSTTGFAIPTRVPAVSSSLIRPNRRRRINYEDGHALEILGHAIEYLTDEFIHEGGMLSAHSAEMEAVQLLMALNRRIYLDCPEVPTFRERLSQFLRIPLHTKQSL